MANQWSVTFDPGKTSVFGACCEGNETTGLLDYRTTGQDLRPNPENIRGYPTSERARMAEKDYRATGPTWVLNDESGLTLKKKATRGRMAFRREMEIGLTAPTAQQRWDTCRYRCAANAQNRKQSYCFWNRDIDRAYVVDLGAGGWSGRTRG